MEFGKASRTSVGRAYAGEQHRTGMGLWGCKCQDSLSGYFFRCPLLRAFSAEVRGPAWLFSSAPRPGSIYSSPSCQALNWICHLTCPVMKKESHLRLGPGLLSATRARPASFFLLVAT